MKKLVITLVILLTAFLNVQGQKKDIFDKMAKQVCKCMENKEVASLEESTPCLEDVIFKNYEGIFKHYGVNSFTDLDTEELGRRLGLRLYKNCPYAYSLSRDSAINILPTYDADSNLNCDGIKTGEYYYLMPNEQGEISDTTFVTISGKEYLERMNGGRTYSRLNIEWLTDCKFKLTFVESNDPLKRTLSKPGDEYIYEIIKNNEHSMVAEIIVHGDAYHFEMVKIKL